MAYVITIGAVLALVLLASFVIRRPRPAGSDRTAARTSTDTAVPGPEGARAEGPVQAPPGSQPDREAHGKP